MYDDSEHPTQESDQPEATIGSITTTLCAQGTTMTDDNDDDDEAF